MRAAAAALAVLVLAALPAAYALERGSARVEVAFTPGDDVEGLIARRIVFWKQPGETVNCGERVGLIKFGSRVDVLLGPEWEIAVRPGMRVSAGSSVLARRAAAEA